MANSNAVDNDARQKVGLKQESGMNKLTAEKCREQFEEWLKSTGQNPGYATKRGYWEIWKASRKALEINMK